MSRDETLEEGIELNKSLRHLRSLRADRKKSLNELQKLIESALLSGKLSGRRIHNTDHSCLSKRAVATIELEASQLKRNLFYLVERERRILARLSEIGSQSGQTTSTAEKNPTTAGGTANLEDSRETGGDSDGIANMV